MSFEGRRVGITGAGSGIGRAMARAFAGSGATVIAVDRDEASLQKIAAELGCESLVLDVTADDAGAALASAKPDVLCNNAGILDGLTPLHDTDDALWDRVLAVNTTAPFKLCRAVVPGMIERGGGVILNTCSAASLSGGRAGFAYTASKHALLGMTRSIAWFYRDQNIRCNALAPGAIQTKMHVRTAPHAEGMAKYADYFPTIGPQGRSKQVADAAVFLAGEGGSYVNGEVLTVDGGWNAF
jgi:NAD(P)-dependent dehydrogenase (short-subunit alcohol dehydrogenase family)